MSKKHEHEDEIIRRLRYMKRTERENFYLIGEDFLCAYTNKNGLIDALSKTLEFNTENRNFLVSLLNLTRDEREKIMKVSKLEYHKYELKKLEGN